jgi:hypothetical protein
MFSVRISKRQTRTLHAHRLAYFLTFGPIPDGLWVLHHCDNPSCCRPDHLFLGTAADNVADMMAKGRNLSGMTVHPERAAKGERHGSRTKPEGIRRGQSNGQSKLTDDDVREIRLLYAACKGSQLEIAARFGVNQTLVSAIVRRVRWTHIE